MGIDDLAGKLDSDKGEQVSDSALEKGEGAASQATGGTHDEHLEKAGDLADKRIGNQ
jgi:hypothetical protein